MDIQTIIKEIEDQYDIELKYNQYFEQYEGYATKDVKISIYVDTYNTGDHRQGQEFISVGWDNRKEHWGGGSPCDNMQEVKEYLERFCKKRDGVQLSLFL